MTILTIIPYYEWIKILKLIQSGYIQSRIKFVYWVTYRVNAIEKTNLKLSIFKLRYKQLWPFFVDAMRKLKVCFTIGRLAWAKLTHGCFHHHLRKNFVKSYDDVVGAKNLNDIYNSIRCGSLLLTIISRSLTMYIT